MIFFRVGIEESITLPEPPVDDISEAEEVKVIVANRSAEDVESIRNHDQEPYYALRKFCEEKGLKFHDGEFDQIIDESVPIISHFKKHFNRDRPVEVDTTINTLPSKTNKTRSYPSGHAAQSRLIARYMAEKNPVHAEELLRAGNECGLGRVKAGFHYMSDYHIGNLLGEKLYIFMNRESDGGS